MRTLTEIKGSFGSETQDESTTQITAVQFNRQGSYLAAGDISGRLIIFATEDDGTLEFSCEARGHDSSTKCGKKPGIGSAVRSISWLTPSGHNSNLISAGQRDVKIWKVCENSTWEVKSSVGNLPKASQTAGMRVQLSVRESLPSLHQSTIKGIDVSHNEQFLLSYDNNKILKWNLQYFEKPFCLFSGSHLNPKRPSQSSLLNHEAMDEEQEFVLFEQEQWNKLDLLTACKFHQPYDNRLGFATKEGTINYVDMRQTNSTEPAIILTPKKPEQFLKRYLNSVSDFFFLDEHTVVSRDYLSVKIWDLRVPQSSMRHFSVYPSLSHGICELYERDQLTDKFSLNLSSDRSSIITSQYDSSFHEINLMTGENIRYKVNDDHSLSTEQVKGLKLLEDFNLGRKVSTSSINQKTGDVCAALDSAITMFRRQPIDHSF